MLALGVLVSGDGSNLQAVLDACAQGALDARVAVVLSNRAEAFALERARRAGVPALVRSHRGYARREEYDAELVRALRAHGVELVVLAGFLRVVTPVLLEAFAQRVVNLHPSLLPAFPGLDAPAQALAAGVRVTGCTVHLVDAGVDTGPVLAQSAVVVRGDDTVATLRARIAREEHVLLPAVLRAIAEGRLRVEAPPGDAGRPRAWLEGLDGDPAVSAALRAPEALVRGPASG